MMLMHSMIRKLYAAFYDIQQIRIAVGHRIYAHFRAKIGQAVSKKDDKKTKTFIDNLAADYKLVTTAIVDQKAKIDKFQFPSTGIISSAAEYGMTRHYLALLEEEKDQLKYMGMELELHSIWTKWLKDVGGIKYALGSLLVAYLNIYLAPSPSSFFKFIGIDVADDGKGRTNHKEHLREYDYVDKDGKTKQKKGLTYNPLVKARIMGVMTDCFIKASNQQTYPPFYYAEMKRLKDNPPAALQEILDKAEACEKKGDKNKCISHFNAWSRKRANRKMIKEFLKDLWKVWSKIEGLPLDRPSRLKIKAAYLKEKKAEEVNMKAAEKKANVKSKKSVKTEDVEEAAA